jgi:hypothetical protein
MLVTGEVLLGVLIEFFEIIFRINLGALGGTDSVF